MKINDVLKENENNSDQIYDLIINSKLFREYYKPEIDKQYKKKTKELGSTDIENNLEILDQILDASQEIIENISLKHATKQVLNKPKTIDFEYRKGPKDTLPLAHNYINKKSQKTVGEPVRKLLFASKSQSTIYIYGKVYHLFPLSNNYKLFYVNGIADFTEDYQVHNREFIEIDNIILDSISNDNFFTGKDIIDIVYDAIYNSLDESFPNIKEEIWNKLSRTAQVNNIDESITKAVYNNMVIEVYDKIQLLNSYVNDIEVTTNLDDIKKESEIMVKTDQFTLLSDPHLTNLIEYYLIKIYSS